MIYVFVETPRFRNAIGDYPLVKECYQRLRERFHLKRASTFTVPGCVSVGGGFFGKQVGIRAIVLRLKTTSVNGARLLCVWAVDVVPREQLGDLSQERYEQEIGATVVDWTGLTGGEGGGSAEDRKRLPEEFSEWWQSLLTPKAEWFIFESEQWAKAVRDFPARYDAYLQKALERIASRAGRRERRDECRVEPQVQTDHVYDQDWEAVYGLAGGHVYLIDLVDWSRGKQRAAAQEIQARKTWEELFTVLSAATNNQEIVDELGRRSVRAYPCLALCDPELSERAIKRTSADEFDVDIALSSEEVEVLDRLCQAENLPLFLQGRAGSGKSTVLYYYLVELLCHLPPELAECGKVQLVTYSPGLVKAVQRVVQRLLRIARKLNQGGTLTDDDWSVRTFYDVCLRQLPQRARWRFLNREFGPDGGYIDAARFRMLYSGAVDPSLERFRLRTKAATTLPWETAWHVIRSYIKGYKLPDGETDFLDPDAYADLPRKDRSVPPREYERVWKEVWPWYRRLTCDSEGQDGRPLFWDDLDLARAVVLTEASEAKEDQGPDNSPADRRAVVLLCDEAQDFSVVELVAVLREFVWLDYDLTKLPSKGTSLPVPLILAGDPFQTVNPSGFRWSIASRIIAEALRQRFGHDLIATIHSQDLRFNYRNPREVGKLANTVQWARRHLFGHASKPQEIWKTHGVSGTVSWLKVDDPEVLDVLRTGPLPLIVPVPVESDEFRRVFGDHVAEQLPKQSVLTPSEIKGLEVSKVAVFGFGKWFAAKELDRTLASIKVVGSKDTFPAEYFFNCLYVAVTRATEQLFIVDSEESIHTGLWHHLRDRWKNAAPEPWRRYVGFALVEGHPDELTSEPGEIARRFWREAEQKEDPTLARRAAFYFHKAGMRRERVVASAYADYWEGKVAEAARALEEEDFKPVALRWYFEASAWDDILASTQGDSAAPYRKLSAFAAEITRPCASLQDVDRKLRLLEEVMNLDLLRDSSRKHIPAKAVTNSLLKESAELAPACRDVAALARVYRAYRHGYLDLYDLPAEHVATLAYRLALLESPEQQRILLREAVALWERSEKTNHSEYHRAQAMTSSYPISLEWWDRANDPQKVLEEFDEYGRHLRNLNSAQRRIVVRALEDAGRWQEAFTIEFVADGAPAAVLARHETALSRDDTKLCQQLKKLLLDQAREAVEQERGIERPSRFYASRLARLAEAIDQTSISGDSVRTGSLGPCISDEALRASVLDFVLQELMQPEREKFWSGWPTEMDDLVKSGQALEPSQDRRLGWVPRWKGMVERLMQERSSGDVRTVAAALRAWLGSMELLFDLRRDENKNWLVRPRTYFDRVEILRTLAGVTPASATAGRAEAKGRPEGVQQEADWFQQQVYGVLSLAVSFDEGVLQDLTEDDPTAETVDRLFRHIEGLARALNNELVGWSYHVRANRYNAHEREQIEREMWDWWERTFRLAMLAPFRKLAVEVAEAWYDFFKSPRIKPRLDEARRRYAEGGAVVIDERNPSVRLGDVDLLIDYVHDRRLVLIQDLSALPPRTAVFSGDQMAFVAGSTIRVRSDGPNRWIVDCKRMQLSVSYDPRFGRLRIEGPRGKRYVIRFERTRT